MAIGQYSASRRIAQGGVSAGPRAAPESFGAGRGLQQLGAASGEVADVAIEIRLKQDRSDYLAKISTLELSNSRAAQELQTTDFEQGTKLSEVYIDNLEKRAALVEVPASMQDRFAQDLGTMRLNFGDKGLQEQARRAGVKAQTDFNATRESAIEMVRIDPSKLPQAQALLTSASQAFPLPKEDKELLVQEQLLNLESEAQDAVIRTDPAGFLADAKANPGKFSDDKISAARSELENQNDFMELDRIAQSQKLNVGLSQKQLDGTLVYNDVTNWQKLALNTANTPQDIARINEFAAFMLDGLTVPEDVLIAKGITKAERQRAITEGALEPEDVRIRKKAEAKLLEARAVKLGNELKRKAGLPVPVDAATVSSTDRSLTYSGFVSRMVGLGAKVDDGKVTKLKARKASLETLLDIQMDVMMAGQAKLLGETDVTELLEAVMPAIETKIGRGIIPGGARVFESKSTDPYSPAFTQVLDHLSKTKEKNTPFNQATILRTVLGEVRAREVMEIKDPTKRVDAFDEAVNAAIDSFETARTPSLSLLGGSRPNAVLKEDGSIEDVSATGTVKADIIVPESTAPLQEIYTKIDGGNVTRDQVLQAAREENTTPENIVKILRAQGIIE